MNLKKYADRLLVAFVLLFLLSACGSQVGLRRFATEPQPISSQSSGMSVLDDGSIVFRQERLEISLQIIGDQFLNRQFSSASNRGAESTNPYTFGNWKPWGQDWTPERFTVVLLRVKNYEYPKVFIDPNDLFLTTSNNRVYDVLDQGLLEDYFSPYLRSYAGTERRAYEAITDQLTRTVYPADMVFSGQETSGYVVFPTLHNDVEEFTVHVPNAVIRFDYKGEPIEELNLHFKFGREIYKALHPHEASK